MNDDELAELECHLAAGTDIPTAFAALPQRGPRQLRWWLLLSFAIALAAWWFLR